MAPLRYTLLEQLFSHQPLGKQHYYRENALKTDSGMPSSFKATYLECADLGEFYKHIQVISNTENCAIILGQPTGIKLGEQFYIRPESWLKTKLGNLEHKDLLGVHQIDGTKVIGRFKDNFQPSRIVLLDYDPDARTPHNLVFKNEETYIEALCTLFGDFAHTGFIVTSSSSAGVISPTGDYLSGNSPKRHVFFIVDDPSDIYRFRDALKFQSIKSDMSWQFKDKGGNAQTRYIFDAVTFDPNRVVYEGRPQLNDGITQDRKPPRYIPGDSLNTRNLLTPTEQEIIDVHQEKGIAPRLVENSATGEIHYTHDLSGDGERRPKLSEKTRFVRADDRYIELTIKDFLASTDQQWRVISEFRCDLSEAPSKSSTSEVLLRSSDGHSCVLYEFDGAITYCFPRNNKVREALHKQIMKNRHKAKPELAEKTVDVIKLDSAEYVTTNVELTPKSLHRGSLHLLFGRPGQGKSQQAIKLAKEGRLIIFATASNEQAEEQHKYCRHPHKELVVSRAYKLKKDYKVDVALQSSGDPFEAPEADEVSTCQRLIQAGKAKNMEHALEIWKSLSTGDSAPPLQDGSIIFTTFERARVWGNSGYFDIKKDTPYNTAKCIRRAVLFVDDVDRESISNYRFITPNVRKWMNTTRADTGLMFETISTTKGNEYLVRQESHAVLKGFVNMSTVFSTVEWRARMMLERQYPDKLRIHDLSPTDNAKDERTDLYLLGTPLVRANYQGLFHLLTELWRRQGTDWLWVGDGVRADENHYTVRGKNAYREHDTIIKVSQPHPDVSDKCLLDIGLEDGNQNVAVAYTMLDQLNQAVGRNQGERYCGKRCVVLVDPQYLKILDEFTGYHAKVVTKVEDISPADIDDEDILYIVNTLRCPAMACRDDLSEGLTAWFRSDGDNSWSTKVEKAMKHYDSETSKARKTRRDRGETMSSGLIDDALQGTSWRNSERKRNLDRKLDAEERLFLKHIFRAIRLTLEAKRDIGRKYPTLRVFQQNKNWRRNIPNPTIRKVMREVLRSKGIK